MRIQMVRNWLWFYDNRAEILSLLAIVITILTSDDTIQQEGLKIKERVKLFLSSGRKVLALFLLFFSVFAYFNSLDIYSKYTVVPDVKEMTYDDAIKSLNNNRLKGQLVLSETNDNLADPNSRVLWQSIEENTVVTLAETVSFLIDDSFSLEYMPLNQYRYGEISVEQAEKLNYVIVRGDNSIQTTEEGSKIDPVIDPHWTIKVAHDDLDYNVRIYLYHGYTYVSADAIQSYYAYAKSLSLTLEELVSRSASAIGGLYDSDDLTVLGKLTPVSETDVSGLRSIDVPNHQGVFLLPKSLPCGTYRFYFSIIDSQYRMYDWYHYLVIEDSE